MDRQADIERLEKDYAAAKPRLKRQLSIFFFVGVTSVMMADAYRNDKFLEVALWAIAIGSAIYDQGRRTTRLHALASKIIEFYRAGTEK